jgi:alkylation response protein AidB-like acyl-CoA dehydrogenase
MADMGLFGLPFPEEYGGMGGDYFALCLALEELARVDQSVAITLEAAVSLGAMPVFRFGTEEQKQQLAAVAVRGEALGAFGLTEPGAGSDAGARAPRRGSRTASGSSTAARPSSPTPAPTSPAGHGHGRHRRDADRQEGDQLDPGAGPDRRASPSSRPYSKVGWNASDTHPLTFDDVRVPEENLLGSAAAATPTSCTSWTRAASPSARSPSAPRRAASTRA